MKKFKTWFYLVSRTSFAALIAIQSIFVGSKAQAISLRATSQIVKVSGQEFEMVVAGSGRNMAINMVDESGKIVKSIIATSTPKAQLMNYSPRAVTSELSRAIKEALANPTAGNAASAAVRKSAPFSVKKMAIQKLQRFPIESFGFFLAIGAIQTFNMALNPGMNPLAYEQHIDTSLDPLGMFAFYTFMVANGAVSEPLMGMIQDGKINRRLMPYVNFMGMGAGMIASNIVHELGHWPGLFQCARELMIPKKATADTTTLPAPPASCDQAYAQWVDRGGGLGLWHEWAPGLAGLVASTVLSGVIMQGLQWAAGKAAMYVAGVQIATLLVPGTLVARVVGIGVWIAQMTMFVGLDEALRPLITTPYRNWNLGGKIDDLEQELVVNLPKAKSKQFEDPTLLPQIKDMSKAMRKWRQMNLEEVEIAHSNWMTALGGLSATYNASQSFYMRFLEELSQIKTNAYPDYIYPIAKTFPLNGVTPTGLKAEETQAFLEMPEDIELMQMETINNVATPFISVLKNPDTYRGISTYDSNVLYNIGIGLRGKTPEQVGKALDLLNKELGITYKNPTEERISKATRERLLALRNQLGDPRPFWKAGEGFTKYYLMAPENQKTAQIPLKMTASNIHLRSATEKLIFSMFWGKNPAQGLIQERHGFKSIFHPPSIRKNDHLSTPSAHTVFSTIFAVPVFDATTGRNHIRDRQKASDNIYAHLLNPNNIRPEVLGTSTESIREWWKTSAETQYVQAFVDYENKYQEIVNRMVNRMWRKDLSVWKYGFTQNNEKSVQYGNSVFNSSNASNAIVPNILQEINLYTMILGEVMKSAAHHPANSVHGFDIWAEGQNPPVNTQGINFYEAPGGGDSFMIAKLGIVPEKKPRLQLLPLLLQNNALEMSALYKAQPGGQNLDVGPVQQKNLKWQNQFLTEVASLVNLLKQIKPVKAKLVQTQHEINVVSSTITNQQLEEARQATTLILDALRGLFGLAIQAVDGSTAEGSAATLVLTPNQKELATFLLEKMEANVSELAQLGQIANAVSYRELKSGEIMKGRCLKPTGMKGFGALAYARRNLENCTETATVQTGTVAAGHEN